MEAFPYLIGRVALERDKSWSMHLPIVFNIRHEENGVILWRPGFTVTITLGQNDQGESAKKRLASIKSSAAAAAYDVHESEGEGVLRYSYRLEQDGKAERAPAFYGSVFDESGHVQVAVHFDDEDGVDLAEYLLTSIGEAPADLANPSVLSDSCIVTSALLEEDASLGLLYRDAAAGEVSGWQFFTGEESPEYLNDADNLSICPLAFVAELFPDIIPYLNAEVGSEYTRTADGLTRSE